MHVHFLPFYSLTCHVSFKVNLFWLRLFIMFIIFLRIFLFMEFQIFCAMTLGLGELSYDIFSLPTLMKRQTDGHDHFMQLNAEV